MKKILTGNEAVALGAIRAGVSVVTGYPGTPSSEIQIPGKRSGYMPRAGEYSPDLIEEKAEVFLSRVWGSLFAVKEAVRKFGKSRKAVFSGDMGCYTLGNALPLEMIDCCLCMEAGITLAQGIADISAVLPEKIPPRCLDINIAAFNAGREMAAGIAGGVL